MASLVSMETIYDGDNVIMVESFSPSDVVDVPSEDIRAAGPFSTNSTVEDGDEMSNNNNFEEINAESSWILDEEPIPDSRSMSNIMAEAFVTSHGLEMPSNDSWLDDFMDEPLPSIDDDELGNFVELLLQASPWRYHTDMVLVNYASNEGASEFNIVPADDKVVMASLKKVKVEDLRNFKVDNDQACSVCLEELGKDEVVSLLPCDHFFHDNCISKWLQKNHVCPLCRFELPVATSS